MVVVILPVKRCNFSSQLRFICCRRKEDCRKCICRKIKSCVIWIWWRCSYLPATQHIVQSFRENQLASAV